MKDPNVFAAVTGKIVNVADIYASSGCDFAAQHAHDARCGHRTRSFAAMPLWSVEGRTVGVLQLFNPRVTEDGEPGPLPVASERVVGAVAAQAALAVANARLFEENRALIRQLDRRGRDEPRDKEPAPPSAVAREGSVVGESPPFKAALRLAERAAASSIATLLLGETGTGKDVFANAIHRLSARRIRPFVAQNCAALPETLLESELFGHRKGAFSGALADKKGLVHEANGGTLFLDEIGDMPLALQAKILRLLEEGAIRRLGDTKQETVDVRIIAATNADLPRKIAEGSFREDLYYRLSVFPIAIPPLRERPSDIPLLIEFFLGRIAHAQGRPAFSLTPRALEALCRWRYPGNVRELRNMAERAALLVDGDERIDLPHLPPHLARNAPEIVAPAPAGSSEAGLRDALHHYEAIYIANTLQVLQRDGIAGATLALPGDGAISVEAETLSLTGRQHLALTGARLDLQAHTLALMAGTTTWLGKVLTGVVERFTLSARRHETSAETMIEKSADRTVIVDGTDSLRAETRVVKVAGIASETAQSKVVAVAEDLRMDGKRISLG
jgi:sigma-54-dependent transcriptional regulator